MKSSVVITGASGYFGAIACKYFSDKGWNVIKASRRSDADIIIDLDCPDAFAKSKLTKPVDMIIHAAAAHEVICVKDPYRSIFQNVAGTRAALDFAVSNNIRKFVYISTFHVYGNATGLITEDVEPIPENDYGMSHLQAEQYVHMYCRKYGINGTCLRPSNFFGIPADMSTFDRWSLVPVAFCKEAMETGKITLKTPGQQERNFVSVLDVCSTIETILSSSNPPRILNVYGNDTLSIITLANGIASKINSSYFAKVTVQAPKGDNKEASISFKSKYTDFVYPNDNLFDFVDYFWRFLNETRCIKK